MLILIVNMNYLWLSFKGIITLKAGLFLNYFSIIFREFNFMFNKNKIIQVALVVPNAHITRYHSTHSGSLIHPVNNVYYYFSVRPSIRERRHVVRGG